MSELQHPAPPMHSPLPSPSVVLIRLESDADAAKALTTALRVQFGIDIWLEDWEVRAGQNVISQLEKAITQAHGALVLLGRQPLGEGIEAEQYTAMLRRVIAASAQPSEGGSAPGPAPFVFPVRLFDDVDLPGFLGHRKALSAQRPQEIAQEIGWHVYGEDFGQKPALGELWVGDDAEAVVLDLERSGSHVTVRGWGAEATIQLSVEEAASLAAGLSPRGGVLRQTGAPPTTHLDNLDRAGKWLGRAFEGALAEPLRDALDASRGGCGHRCVLLRADAPGASFTLALPWEAAHVPAGAGRYPLALAPRVSVVRERPYDNARSGPSSAGPLRLLVAIAAPRDDTDYEHESKVILDALDAVDRAGARRAYVVFVEEGRDTLEAIREALQRDAQGFHVLHVSAHGGPDGLQFEDDDGQPRPVTAEQLAEVLLSVERSPGLVVLSACSTAASPPETLGARTHVADALLAAGVPQVIAMQHPVGDGYATELAGHLYRYLMLSPDPVAAHALAEARREVERQRVRAADRGHSYRADQPEYATPVIYAQRSRALNPLYDGRRPHLDIPPPLAQISVDGLPLGPIGSFVGRRDERRTLREAIFSGPGAVISGLGGIGKSALAAQLMTGIARAPKQWACVAVVGRVDLRALAEAAASQLRRQAVDRDWPKPVRDRIAQLPMGSEDQVVEALCELLTSRRLLLVLDNFEDNLDGAGRRLPKRVEAGQRAGVPADMQPWMRALVQAAASGAGAIVVTCRYPLQFASLRPIELGELTGQARRRLLWRLPGLLALPESERAAALRTLGGHPRVLEWADALLRAEPGEFEPAVGRIEERLGTVNGAQADAAALRDPLPLHPEDWDESDAPSAAQRIAWARQLAAADVLLPALLGALQAPERQVLLAAALFEMPVPVSAIRAVLQIDSPGDSPGGSPGFATNGHLRRLRTLGLVAKHASESGESRWLVHRWTAAEILERNPPEPGAHARAAAWWAVQGSTWEEHSQVLTHLLAARAWEAASEFAERMRKAASQSSQNAAALEVCARLIDALPSDRIERAMWEVNSSEHLLAKGDAQGARARLVSSVAAFETIRATATEGHPVERYLSVSYDRLGDLHVSMGEGERAKRYYEDSLDIAQQLAAREPERSDLQRDLSVSFNKLGDLHRAMGEGERAKRYYEDSLRIRQPLAAREPERSDLQRDLSVSFNKLGDLHVSMGEGERARRYYEDSLNIAQKLAARQPGRSDLQRDLSVSYERLGDLHRAMGEGERAKRYYEDSLDIAQELAAQQPLRSDLQRDLSVSFLKLGDLHVSMGEGERAKRYYEDSLRIREPLAAREPEHFDRQGDLAISFERMAAVSPADARAWLDRAFKIRRRRVAMAPQFAVVHRELAGALVQRFQVDSAHREMVAEAVQLLDALDRKGALEAQYRPLLDALRREAASATE